MDILPQHTFRRNCSYYLMSFVAERWSWETRMVKISAISSSIRLSRLTFTRGCISPSDTWSPKWRIGCLGLELAPRNCLVDSIWLLLDESHCVDRLQGDAPKAKRCSLSFSIWTTEDSSCERRVSVSLPT